MERYDNPNIAARPRTRFGRLATDFPVGRADRFGIESRRMALRRQPLVTFLPPLLLSQAPFPAEIALRLHCRVHIVGAISSSQRLS